VSPRVLAIASFALNWSGKRVDSVEEVRVVLFHRIAVSGVGRRGEFGGVGVTGQRRTARGSHTRAVNDVLAY